jgi:hypothetical protein
LSYLASIRKQHRSWGRSALGLFAAVWLNLALQPCAMAYEVENDHECPHCPPAEMQGHHDMHDGMDAGMPCADGLSDCSLDPDFSHDGRGGQTQLKDVKSDGPAIAVPMDLVAPFDTVARERSPPRFETVHSGSPPPLHVLYCVYLD